MRVRAQIGMVLNLDKCIGCHTCSVTCKNVWTSRDGVEYAWFNNVETKPGTGYPTDWENQDALERRLGADEVRQAAAQAGQQMADPGEHLRQPRPARDRRLLRAVRFRLRPPEIRARDGGFPDRASALEDHRRADARRSRRVRTGRKSSAANSRNAREDYNFEGIQKEIYGEYENTFMMYLPRLCEHCLNPACAASCPSGAIYKREEDGIVLIDQEKCRGWRMCVSGCPYKKVYYNWSTGKSEKCTLCYPRIESGNPTVCSETCVGRIRYLGVMLYDADKIEEAANVPDENGSL